MAERNMQLEDWLDDLCVRFIMNVPQADLSTVERICFQIEEAQWYYEDFIRPLDPTLPSLSLRNFCEKIWAHCPLFSVYAEGFSMQAFEEFLKYKKRIPVRGAIMLNEAMDSVILVKGWKKGANWSFPRGKTNMEEDPLICAIREVYEETGYDLGTAELIPEGEEAPYIEINIQEQQLRLYIFKGVPEDTHFEPRTRKEISKIQWWKLSSLPAFRKRNQQDAPQPGPNANKFYVVAPFLVKLRKWIIEEKKRDLRRVSHNQRYSTGVSHDDLFTEEDQGAESADATPMYAPEPPSMEDVDTLGRDGDVLNRLLKIQNSDSGLTGPPPAPSPPSFPAAPPVPSVVTNSGSALLALLHNKPVESSKSPPKNSLFRTPLDQEIEQPTMPTSPQHRRPPPPSFAAMPPPPNFPVQQQPPLPWQQPHNYQIPPPQQAPIQHRFPNVIPHGNPHSNQPPHLVHPQPLPPHVQRAVFTGLPAHAPMAPQAFQQRPPPLNPNMPATVPNSQFPSSNFHPTTIPQEQKQSPPKLTSHSLALLNAFKTRDQVTIDPDGSNDLPLRRYVPQQVPAPPSRSQPQELLGDVIQQAGERYPEVSVFQSHNTNLSMNEKLLTARQTISERQKSTLLDIFKSPTTTRPAPPAEPLSATALPTSATPSAVELSAVEPLSSNAPSTAALLISKRPTHGANKILELNPEANLPYRAHSILSRPSELSDQEIPIRSVPVRKAQPQTNARRATNASNQESKLSSPEKPFRPQILKRPQPGLTKIPASSPPAAETMLPGVRQPFVGQKTTEAADHRQNLLSIFGKSIPDAAPMSKNSSTDGKGPITALAPTRSRVSSLASGNGSSRRSPISPADKGFLLGYLEAVAKGAQR